MAELRDIFRAEDGSEWHAWESHFSPGCIYVQLPPMAHTIFPVFIKYLKSKIEGPYRVWSAK